MWRKWEYLEFILWSTMIFSARNGSKNLTRVSIFVLDLSSQIFFRPIFQRHFLRCCWWLHLTRYIYPIWSFIEFLLYFGKINISNPTLPLYLMNQTPLTWVSKRLDKSFTFQLNTYHIWKWMVPSLFEDLVWMFNKSFHVLISN